MADPCFISKNLKNITPKPTFPSTDILRKITAVWAFTEATLGGFLHLMQIPFTGLIVGGFASFFICLLAYYGGGRRVIWKSTLIVLVVKFVVSPYTPLTAFLSVALQGFLGQLLLFNPRYYRYSAPLFCVAISLIFSLQKVLFTSILFGMEFWRATTEYINFIIEKVFYINTSIDYASWLVLIYIFLHLLGGAVAAYASLVFPELIRKNIVVLNQFSKSYEIPDEKNNSASSKKRKKKFFKIFILLLLLSGSLLPYLSSEFENRFGNVFIIILARAILILIVWSRISKTIMKQFVEKYAEKLHKEYSEEVKSILITIPSYKMIIKSVNRQLSGESFLKKYPKLVLNSLIIFIFTEIE